MAENDTYLFNRRDLARVAMIGGASVLLGGAAFGASRTPAEGGLLDARKLGAVGDGTADDTLALQRAFDAAASTSGGVFVPPGVYLTKELHVRPGMAVLGVPAWSYGGPGGSVLRLKDAGSTCLLNLTDARGASIEGLSLDGRGLGTNIHGISTNRSRFAEREDGFRVERCQVARFSGNGANLSCAWCFSVRHSMLAYNKGDGLNLRGWDGFLMDNWFSGNERAGFAARLENASVTFTANRVEWNGEENMLVTGGDGYQITGNFFDRAGTCGIALRRGKSPCSQITLTGNFLKRSGKLAREGSHESSQIFMDGCQGVTCIGNSLCSGRDDGNTGVYSPSYGIIYKGLKNCVIRDNVLHDGALKELLLDLGGLEEGVVIGDNPGRLFATGD
ncbi:MAG: right-handed parallel beta-helix repeat-containing protein [Opitutaceae bacterium]